MRRLNAENYETDKPSHVIFNYERHFAEVPFDQPMVMIELGIHKGGSLRMWRDYFSRGIIVGVDANPVEVEDSTGRIRVYRGFQQDRRLIERIAREVAPEGFDIVIDDASHIAEYTRQSFWCLFEHHLKRDGLYFIEDWGTGYWNRWPDGKYYSGENHLHGMVGFIKELVDECGASDITLEGWGVGSPRSSRISSMEITPSHVILRKA